MDYLKIDPGKMIVQEDFYRTIEEVKKNNFNLPFDPSLMNIDFDPLIYPNNQSVLTKIEEIEKDYLDIVQGQKMAESGRVITGYDESIELFPGLEGSANLTAHCLVIHGLKTYIPLVYVTYYFYTRSKKYAQNSKTIRFSSKPEEEIKKDYATDRKKFLTENVPENSVLLIDGPLIGGNLSYYTRELNRELIEKNIIPVFFVKNTNSNLVSDNLSTLVGKFNSDLDWAHKTLEKGQRTAFFRYVDKQNPLNGKIFCYFKTSPLTVQRIEFDVSTFEKYRQEIKGIMDLILYLLQVQGNNLNPQVRTIAVAEKYAREVLKFIRNTKLNNLRFTPTMNAIRFGRQQYEMDSSW